jgi:hypothetical protein
MQQRGQRQHCPSDGMQAEAQLQSHGLLCAALLTIILNLRPSSRAQVNQSSVVEARATSVASLLANGDRQRRVHGRRRSWLLESECAAARHARSARHQRRWHCTLVATRSRMVSARRRNVYSLCNQWYARLWSSLLCRFRKIFLRCR